MKPYPAKFSTPSPARGSGQRRRRNRRRPLRWPQRGVRRYEAVALPASRGVYARNRGLRQATEFKIDRRRLSSAALLAIVLLVGVWIGFDETFYIAVPKVTGQAHVPAEEIARASGLIGLHVAWANPAEVESRLLEALPSLRAARVTCALPADCAIAVTEREPLLAWRWGDAVVGVDAGGVVYSARGDVQSVLTIEASDAPPPALGERIDPDLMTAIVSAAQALPDVRTFRYTLARGLEFADARGYPVYLGTGSNMADRAALWRALRADLASREIVPAYIDVRFLLAPYYGRR